MSEVQTQFIEPKKPASGTSWKQLLFSFKGRVGRKQYWYYSLGVFLSILLTYIVWIVLFAEVKSGNDNPILLGVLFLSIIAPLIILIWSSIAIQVKRLHDLDKSGWFLLVSLIPYVGALIMMIWLGFFKGTEGDNRFGRPYNT